MTRPAAARIARLDSLKAHPSAFRHLTGLTVPAVDALATDVVPAVEVTHRRSLDRPDRERAIGAGGEFGLTTTDQMLLNVGELLDAEPRPRAAAEIARPAGRLLGAGGGARHG